ELDARNIKWCGRKFRGFRQNTLGKNEVELRVAVHELLDEPGTGHAVHLNVFACYPFHRSLLMVLDRQSGWLTWYGPLPRPAPVFLGVSGIPQQELQNALRAGARPLNGPNRRTGPSCGTCRTGCPPAPPEKSRSVQSDSAPAQHRVAAPWPH